MVAEAASLSVLQGSEYGHANDDSGQQRHDQPPLPGARPPAETYPLPSKPRFMFWHRVPLKLGYWLARPTLPTRPGRRLSLPRDTAGQALLAFAPPWLHLGLTAVALPAIIALGSWLTAQGTRVRFTSRSAIC